MINHDKLRIHVQSSESQQVPGMPFPKDPPRMFVGTDGRDLLVFWGVVYPFYRVWMWRMMGLSILQSLDVKDYQGHARIRKGD